MSLALVMPGRLRSYTCWGLLVVVRTARKVCGPLSTCQSRTRHSLASEDTASHDGDSKQLVGLRRSSRTHLHAAAERKETLGSGRRGMGHLPFGHWVHLTASSGGSMRSARTTQPTARYPGGASGIQMVTGGTLPGLPASLHTRL